MLQSLLVSAVSVSSLLYTDVSSAFVRLPLPSASSFVFVFVLVFILVFILVRVLVIVAVVVVGLLVRFCGLCLDRQPNNDDRQDLG